MSYSHRLIFIAAHSLGKYDFYPVYQRLVKNQWRPLRELKEEQDKQLRHMIRYCQENVPYYRDLFKNLGLSPEAVRTAEDLHKLPVLTKDTIKENWDAFKPVNLDRLRYIEKATGGSTGVPLKYRQSTNDRFLSGVLLYRGWGYGGYALGDRMVFLAGSSLNIGRKSNLQQKAHEFTRNIRKLSSFDMGEQEMRSYAGVLNAFRPRFIRGYATSVYLFAQWLEKNEVAIPYPEAVFTTAEKLFPPMRKKIGQVFNCGVFDTYGLNDGGVGAYECAEHAGLHVDTERSIMEIVDAQGARIEEGTGEILATSLHNFAMPFLRYRTEDLASVLRERCPCGRQSVLLKDIIGRESDFLQTPDGRNVHGAALFNLIFHTLENSPHRDNVNRIQEFQIVQKKKENLEILLVCKSPLPGTVLDFIATSIRQRFPGWDVEFRFREKIDRTPAGKYKFVINEIGGR